MILIEITSDEANKLFDEIPEIHQNKISILYSKALRYCRKKPDFIRINCLELVKFKFIHNKFMQFDVYELIEDFCDYFFNLGKNEKKLISMGYEEDLNEILYQYFNCK